ncbi:Uncharacterized protein ALO94_05565 [Pseudomonas syringae pv. spinaceae]|uniref:Uncharacterized protein n=1 Tax=Pseudomonas syringae pv. spinaceae TaxID=264459 RepID=A0A0Q0BJ20_PSESX|nr:Uncharacterized protein ALO94_05565 [Pseudomonas syringae pv. spinaceae]
MNLDAQPAANDLTVFDDRLHDIHRQLGRDSEADALRAAGLGKDRGIDADQIASGIHQRTARVAGVDGCVGLNEVFIRVQAQLVTPSGADDAHRHGLADAERVADGQCHVADTNAVGARDGNGWQVFQIDFQDRKVGFRVVANDSGDGFAAVLERHHDLVRASGDVVIGQDVAFRAHHHARAKAGLHALLFRRVVAKEAPELRVFKKRVGALVHHLGGIEVDHRWRCGNDRIGIGRGALHDIGRLWRLLQIDIHARQANPLRITLDDQQGDKHASQQWPAEKTQCLEHLTSPDGCGRRKFCHGCAIMAGIIRVQRSSELHI